jgi:pimeloyl-ACP methyl ester carboxylesterase
MPAPTAIPRTDRTVTLRDGRSLAFAEWGDPDGRPLLFLHGRPGSRLLCPNEQATKDAGVRLITVDRPGYGRSDPRPGRTLLDWAGDIEELADRLDLSEFPVIGWSTGGPHALACAIGIPERVTKVGLAASPGPHDRVPGAWDELPKEVRILIERVRTAEPRAMEGVEQRAKWYVDNPDAMLDPIDPDVYDPDNDLLARPEIREPMRVCMREGARQGSAGFVGDWIAELPGWGFSPADIQHETYVWWGEGDVLVSRRHAEYLASTIPRAELVTYPGEGHLICLTRWGEMLSSVL